MMKTAEKIQIALLKNQMKKEAGKRHDNVLIASDDDSIYACIAGHRLHRIPKTFWFLNLETLQPNNKSITNLFYKEIENCTVEAFFTGISKQVNGGTVLQIATRDGFSIWLSEKLVKEYGNANDLVFLVNPEKKYSVAIPRNEYGYEMGIICPVNVNEG